MRILKYEFGVIKGKPDFDYLTGACGCKLWSLGFFYFTALSKECLGIINE